jgi:hypothetical protein
MIEASDRENLKRPVSAIGPFRKITPISPIPPHFLAIPDRFGNTNFQNSKEILAL